MHIRDVFAQDDTTLSFEFFPPKTQAIPRRSLKTSRSWKTFDRPSSSVTYGAGGSSRQLTHDLVVRINRTTSLDATPHLTCVCQQTPELEDILDDYAKAGISNILALSGDPPRDQTTYNRTADAFQHAAGLVEFIRKFNESGRHADKRGFGIGVAGFPEGHPATPNRLTEMDYLKAKVDAGADYICTQLFFENRDFYDFRERCELAGIRVPIIAGIMPVTSVAGMKRMAELSAGSRFPAPLLKAVGRAQDAASVKAVGIHWATEQCRDLIDNGRVKGIHLYTLNKSDATRQIYRNLGVRDSMPIRRTGMA